MQKEFERAIDQERWQINRSFHVKKDREAERISRLTHCAFSAVARVRYGRIGILINA